MTGHTESGVLLLVLSPAVFALAIYHVLGYRKGGRYDHD
jgi:hypothetical protein